MTVKGESGSSDAFQRALAAARRGLTLRTLCLAAGGAAGAGLAVAALGIACGVDGTSADLVAASACTAGAVLGMAWKRPRVAAAAGTLDEALGTQAFGAAYSVKYASGGGRFGELTAREAVRALGARDPVKLILRDWTLAFAGPAVGVALILLAPLAARTLGTPERAARAERADALASIRAAALSILTNGPPAADPAKARELAALADRAVMALTSADEKRLDAEVARAASELFPDASGAAGAAEGGLAIAKARAERFRDRERSRPGPALPVEPGPGGNTAAAGTGGGTPASAKAPSGVTFSGPTASASPEAVAHAPAWPSRYDAVVRLYFEGAQSKPGGPLDELPASNPEKHR